MDSHRHAHIHTHMHKCTNSKNTEFCYNKNDQNSAYYVGTIRFTELRVKQVANRPADLPRVQAPVHMLDGAPGVHHKRRPQGMTKMIQKYTELLLNCPSKLEMG